MEPNAPRSTPVQPSEASPPPPTAANGPDAGRTFIPPRFYIALTGVWLLVAPFVLNYRGLADASQARWNDIAVGAVLIVVACVRPRGPGRTWAAGLLPILLSVWLMAAPFVLRYGGAGEAVPAIWNDVVAGLLLLVFAHVNGFVIRPSRNRPVTTR